MLILAFRILAIASLVFAFAQPYLPSSENQKAIKGKNTVSIFIDNSFSMQAVTDQALLLDIAKNKAREIVSAYSNSDEFQLLTHDFEGKHQRLYNKEEFLQLLDETEISPSVRKLPEIIKRQQDAVSMAPQSNKVSYIISDFQKSISIFNLNNLDTSLISYLIPVTPQKVNNLYIDSCWYESPVLQINKNVKLNVKIKNSSDIPYEKVPLKLMVNGKQRAIASVDVKENDEVTISLSYKINEGGIQSGFVEITDYPIVYDDKFYFSYKVAEFIPVLIINEKEDNQYLNKLYSLDSVFKLTNTTERNIDIGSFKTMDLIILNGLKNISSGLAQELKRFTDNGGSLIIFPSNAIDFESYKQLSTLLNIDIYESKDSTDTKVEQLNIKNPVFADVFEKIPENIDLPSVFSFYTFAGNKFTNKEFLLKMLNARDFFTATVSGKGIVYQSAVPLEASWSNFPRHAIFVPTFFNIALQSQPQNYLFYTIGNDDAIGLKNIILDKEETLLLKGDQAGFEIIPEHKNRENKLEVLFHNQIKLAGSYHLFKNKQAITDVSFNYDRNESRLDFYSNDELNKQIKDNQLTNIKLIETKNKHLGELIKEINQGIKLWKLFVFLTLIFLLGETILIRFWK